MFPEKFIQRVESQEYIDPGVLLAGLREPSPVSIRINQAKWKKKPEKQEPVPWCSSAYYLETRPSFTLDPLFHAGCYYPQEASSMFIEQVYRHCAGDIKNIRVLDLCGAPGGKSTHLSSLIGENGLLVANEVIRSRASVLAENLTKWGFSNSIVTQSDPSAFGRLEGFFDIILVDAPCSGEGMFRDRVAVDEWSEGNAALCSERQRRILADVWPALKENGLLIYSTCTFNPDENEKNIKWLSESRKTETVQLDVSEYERITEIDYNGITGYAFYPGKIKGDGFFIAVIRKKEANKSMRPVKKQGRNKRPENDEVKIAGELAHFDRESLIRIGGEIVSIPSRHDDFNLLSENLRLIKPGTHICTLKNKNYIPSHELAMSLFLRKSVFFTLNLEYADAINYLKRDNINAGDTSRGWMIASYEGVNLGFVNNLGSRLNNYYPVEWRIRMNLDKGKRENRLYWKASE